MSALAELIELACLMEATARKPGNVHPGASFVDLRYEDFVQAAAAIAPVIAAATPETIGATVLRAIEATQQHARTNINLGIVLLLTPLAAVPRDQSIAEGLPAVLSSTTQRDTVDVYRAIRLANPGGLGKVDNQDVAEEPTQTLLEVMQLAAERDLIAAQYGNGFAIVQSLAARLTELLSTGDSSPAPSPPSSGESAGVRGLSDQAAPHHAPSLAQNVGGQHDAARGTGPLTLTLSPDDGGQGTGEVRSPWWEAAVIGTFLELLAQHPDSLIARKAGIEIARETQRRATVVIHNARTHQPDGGHALRDFDAWLRADGHRRNPGTSADLIAAALFVALRDGGIAPPTRDELRTHATAINPVLS